jgi:hypothetical protein
MRKNGLRITAMLLLVLAMLVSATQDRVEACYACVEDQLGARCATVSTSGGSNCSVVCGSAGCSCDAYGTCEYVCVGPGCEGGTPTPRPQDIAEA